MLVKPGEQAGRFRLEEDSRGPLERGPGRRNRQSCMKPRRVRAGDDDAQALHAAHPGSLGRLNVRNRSESESATRSFPALSSPKDTIQRIASIAARLPII